MNSLLGPSLVGGLLFSRAALPDAGAGCILGRYLGIIPTQLGPPREGRPFFMSGRLVALFALLATLQHLARPVELLQPLLGDT
jgi:hypothetical protein